MIETRYPESGAYKSAAELHAALMRAANELPALPDWMREAWLHGLSLR